MKKGILTIVVLLIMMVVTFSCTPVHRSSSSYTHYYGDTNYKRNKKIEYSKRNHNKHIREIKNGFKQNSKK